MERNRGREGNKVAVERVNIGSVASWEDIDRWYWTRAELVLIAKRIGCRGLSGSKSDLAEKIKVGLGKGEKETSCGKKNKKSNSRVHVKQLVVPFHKEMMVPAGQVFSRELREWVCGELGVGKVRVGGSTRSFLKNPPNGSTLNDLLIVVAREDGNRKVGGERKVIMEQFEFNRFMRALSEGNNKVGRCDALKAWSEFKLEPVEERRKFLSLD